MLDMVSFIKRSQLDLDNIILLFINCDPFCHSQKGHKSAEKGIKRSQLDLDSIILSFIKL